MILHVPHSSTLIPANVRKGILLNDAELEHEILAVTGLYTDELFGLQGESAVVFPFSRLVVDPERFTDDRLEPRARIGMGAIYSKTSDGRALRKELLGPVRTEMLNNYYCPHHRKLSIAVNKEISKFGKTLIIDCHSFPSKPFPIEADQNSNRLDICIGTDQFHTSIDLKRLLYECFTQLGYKVAFNHPYSGTVVPLDFYGKDQHVASIMIEVNRKLYMNEVTGEKNTKIEGLKKDILSVLKSLKRWKGDDFSWL